MGYARFKWRRAAVFGVVPLVAATGWTAGYTLSEKVEGPGRTASVVSDPEYETVIHPGPADGSRIWNANANWFMYAPAFAFSKVAGAKDYRFEVTDDLHRVHTFSADRPTAPLAPVWSKLPTGYVTVVCTGFDAEGKPRGEAGRRTFWKAAGFREGAYPPAARSYRAAALGVYSYIFDMKETQYLLEHGKPDPSYELNTYASKMLGALIRGMIRYAQLAPGKRERALAVAHAAADHLIARSQPADAPLAHFPPTYDGRGEKDNDYLAEKLNDQVMLIYPAQVAGAFLDLARTTGEAKYREQAVRIASTYLRLQGEDGTWPLSAYLTDGRPVGRNRLIPVQNVVPLFERLYDLTKDETYRRAADRAFATLAGRLEDWNWEGQFEDIAGSARYQNLTKHDACSTAIYFASRFLDDPVRRAEMRELLRFAEDQFVCWEPPYRHGRWRPGQKFWNNEYDKWFTPCALEQYACYVPIDSSAAKLIKAYLALYRTEGRAVDLAKARALGDTATRAQFPDGRIPTWWWPDRAAKRYADWINCMMATAEALLELDAVEKSVGETVSLQRRIDEVAAQGGGRVTVGPGRHRVGQIELRSNVELHLEEDAVLEGLPGRENYRTFSLPYSEGDWSAVVVGESVTNVAITGKGEIFGNGTAWPQPDDQGGNQEGMRPRGIVFANCRDVRLSDFTLRDSACWGIVLKCCVDVTARRIRIDSHANSNNDGFDIEAKNVLIEDCDVDSGDDAYCLKSNDPGFAVENVIVRNCIGRSHCNVFKLGTASHGTMRNIRFEHCRAEAPRRDFEDRRPREPGRMWFRSRRRPGQGYPEGIGISAISIENVDGGTVEDVVFSDIEVSGTVVPFFIRGGMRFGRACGTTPSDRYVLRNLTLSGIRGTCEGPIAASVSGVDGCRPAGVVLRDIDIVCHGAGRAASELALKMPVTYNPSGYPEATHSFAPSILPAYGLYVDRANDVEMKDVAFKLKDGTEDARPPVCVTDKVRPGVTRCFAPIQP